MGNRYSADRIAKDHIHTDITCNTEEPQQKYRLGTVIDYWGLKVVISGKYKNLNKITKI